MKILCECNATIHDGTDGLPHKAHFIPDGKWNPLFDAIDQVIENRCGTPAEREAACMELRSLIGREARVAYRCHECGRLWVDGEFFKPEVK